VLSPIILIGCGGSGVLSVRFVRDEVRARLRARNIDTIPAAWQFIGLDTVRVMTDLADASPLPSSDFLSLTGGFSNLDQLELSLLAKHRPEDSRGGYNELAGWRPDPFELPGNLTQGAGKHRAVGRMLGTFTLNASSVRDRLTQALTSCNSGGAELNAVATKLGHPTPDAAAVQAPIVVVIGSSAGGTGAGIMLDVVDLLRRLGSQTVEPILLVYSSDIFGARADAPMAANSLMFTSELMNAYYANGSGATGLFPAPLNPLLRRGPHAVMMLGRKNLGGMDLVDSQTVYRATALSLAGWITTPKVRKEVQDHVIGNWNSMRIGAMGGTGFAKSSFNGVAISFGSAGLAVGRARFKAYSRAYLMRDLYEHHSTGFLRIATAILGPSGAKGADDVIRLNLAEHERNGFMSTLGVVQKFDKDFNFTSGAEGQVTDVLCNRTEIQRVATEISGAIQRSLPAGNLSRADWVRLIDGEERRAAEAVLAGAHRDFATRQTEWAQKTTEKIIVESNRHLTRVSLPVMADLIPAVAQAVQASAADFRNASRAAEAKVLEFRERRRSLLDSIGDGNVTKDSNAVKDAIRNLGFSRAQEFKRDCAIKIAQTLDQIALNVLNPLRSALGGAEAEVIKMTQPMYGSEAAEITRWPSGDVVPSAFMPSDIEYLLEDNTEWPTILRNLLDTAEPRLSGESAIESVRRGICAGTDLMGGALGESGVAPLLWMKEGSRVEFSATSPMSLQIGLDLESLEERVDHWLSREGRAMSRHLSTGLSAYLSDPASDDRLRKFKQRFDLALEQAKPLCEIDTTYFNIEYPEKSETQLRLQPVIEPLPFPPGHPARAAAEQLIRARLSIPPEQPVTAYFGDRDVEGVVVTNFLGTTVFPGMVSSFTSPIARYGSPVRGNAVLLRAWLSFKRARTLDEFIPVPEVVLRALIRGFAVGRLLGFVTLDTGEGSAVATRGEVLKFPTPGILPLGRDNTVTSILASLPLVFTELPTLRQRAFAAYGALFELGVTRNDLVQSEQFEVVGELKNLVDDGRTDIKPIDPERQSEIVSRGDRAGRVAECVAILNSNVDRFKVIRERAFNGREVVNARGVVEWEDAVTKEIVHFLIAEFEAVSRSITAHGERAKGASGPVRA
jgi:hypothetical protein